jgi:S1-C subfamily serine protease
MQVAFLRSLVAASLVLACPALALAQGAADPGSMAYKKVLPSTVYIMSHRGGTTYSNGSGSLIDHGRRLVVTNYHVVSDVKRAIVFFPRAIDQRVVSDPQYYRTRMNQIGIPGEVVELNKTADLALIRLEKLPADAPGLVIAKNPPEPGQSVHSIGNPASSGAFWIYTPGKVRQLYSKKWTASGSGVSYEFRADVVETDSPINPGDSGGPLVNDRGELVGIAQGNVVTARNVSTFIDASELSKMLRRSSVIDLPSDDPAPIAKKSPSLRTTPVKSEDAGHVFSDEAWKKAFAAGQMLYAKKKFDFVVETFEPPAEEAGKLKAMTAMEKAKYFHARSDRRVDADKLSGIHVQVCTAPKYVYVRETASVVGALPKGFAIALRDAILAEFKEKRYDDGLNRAVNMTIEACGLAAGN